MRAGILCLLAAALSLAAGRTEGDEAKKQPAGLEGTWRLESLTINGEAREGQFAEKAPRWVIKKDRVLYGGEELAVLKVDATTTPPTIDLAFRKKERVYEGVYSLDGDALEICVSGPDGGVRERPLDFATEGKPARRLLVFRREKPGAEDEGLTGFVGVAIKYVDDRKQVAVAQVLDDSPAKKAGLKPDDVILQVGGAEASDLRTVVRHCQQAKPGSKLTFHVRRGDKEQDVVVKVEFLPFTLLLFD